VSVKLNPADSLAAALVIMPHMVLAAALAAAAIANAGDSWVRANARVLPSSIRKVHVVQACHLDVGFTGLAIEVVNLYFDEHFPSAIATAEQLALNTTPGAPRLTFLAQSWLLALYLDCDHEQAAHFPRPPSRPQPNCAAAVACANMPGTRAELPCRVALQANNCSGVPPAPRAAGQLPPYQGKTEAQCLAAGCCYTEGWWCDATGMICHQPPVCSNAGPGVSQPPALHCPNASMVEKVKAALKQGQLAFHAFPFNAQPELLDPSLFAHGLALTRKLAERVGVPPPVVLSQRDVPGLTRAVIPLLARAGVLGINIGVNDASAPVGVPSVMSCMHGELAQPFVWADKHSNTSVLAAWHPGGYGAADAVGAGGDFSQLRCACLATPGLDEALCYDWKSDNTGPPDNNTVVAQFDTLRQAFPNAMEVVASTFDAFYRKLNAPAIREALPIVEAESGDTWLYGASSDPRKLALLRLYMRARRAALMKQEMAEKYEKPEEREPGMDRFSDLLIKASEHTWGGGRGLWTGQYASTGWTNRDFDLARTTVAREYFRREEDGWHEQRGYFDAALAALGPASELAAVIKKATAALDAAAKLAPGLGMEEVPAGTDVLLQPAVSGGDRGGGMLVRLDPASGAIVKLIPCLTPILEQGQGQEMVAACTGHSYASVEQPLARFVYKTRSASEGAAFYANYSYVQASWAPPVFEKAFPGGMPNTTSNATTNYAQLVTLRANNSCLLAELQPPSLQHLDYGGPAAVKLRVCYESAAAGLSITLAAVGKTPTRLPEEAWIEFRPALLSSSSSGADADGEIGDDGATATLEIEKLGSMLDPADILLNGSRTLHAAGDEQGVVFTEGKTKLRLISFDAGLVSPGPASANMDLYAFPGVLPKAEDGVAFSLWNNLWGCNYIYWYPYDASDADFGFRFSLRLESLT
jgi:hypothetical protein